ncbi:MAG TPA: TatD family hydrolase [Tepidisphaeraceae bacterium]|jgi:TatD DNase family protein|nr:TatD family hydrolase [Tepidisphaeraceae bacterium]
MFDTHCHLTDPRLFEQLQAVLDRAAAAGVNKIVTIGTHPADWEAALAVTQGRPHIRCAVGAHPNYCHEIELGDLQRLRHYFNVPAVVAIGEMGLDYHYDFAPRQRQAQYFQAQLELAREARLPVIIHCREAVDDCLSILGAFADVRAVFHCFTGTGSEARRIWDAGHLVGFTGVVTFRNGQSLREVAAAAPADRFLVETDAPYLSPEPMRKQKINEPALVIHTAAMVAAARNISVQELDRMTTGNAMGFYRWVEEGA